MWYRVRVFLIFGEFFFCLIYFGFLSVVYVCRELFDCCREECVVGEECGVFVAGDHLCAHCFGCEVEGGECSAFDLWGDVCVGSDGIGDLVYGDLFMCGAYVCAVAFCFG